MSLISFESKQETELVTNYIKESGAISVFNLNFDQSIKEKRKADRS